MRYIKLEIGSTILKCLKEYYLSGVLPGSNLAALVPRNNLMNQKWSWSCIWGKQGLYSSVYVVFPYIFYDFVHVINPHPQKPQKKGKKKRKNKKLKKKKKKEKKERKPISPFLRRAVSLKCLGNPKCMTYLLYFRSWQQLKIGHSM